MSKITSIKGYEGLYQITREGNITSLRRNKAMKPFLTGDKGKQYYRIELSKKGIKKTFAVHRLVAQTFISNPDNCPEVNHKDGDKLNNNDWNLEWCTRQQNMKHAQDNNLNYQQYGEDHPMSKLKSYQVFDIRIRRSKGEKLIDLAKRFNTSKSNVSYICRGETRIYG